MKHIFYVKQLFSENSATYETMWKNKVEPDRPQVMAHLLRMLNN